MNIRPMPVSGRWTPSANPETDAPKTARPAPNPKQAPYTVGVDKENISGMIG
jgi:hypothetical protein